MFNNLPTILFHWDGRLNRLQYLGYTVLMSVISMAIMAVLMWLVETYDSAFALVLVATIFFIWCYSMIILDIKRLHDMDFAGLHLVWIIPLGFLGDELKTTQPTLSAIIAFVYLVISLGMVFGPGTSGWNRFGSEP